MSSGQYQFERFVLDSQERQLYSDGEAVALNTRYLDALILLLEKSGMLVTKEQFFDEVWCGVPVTDEALSQCIKTLRRLLGDNANNPQFIETVPKHGYRFITAVENHHNSPAFQDRKIGKIVPKLKSSHSWRLFLQLGSAGTIGGGVAGLFGGLFYGFTAAVQSQQNGVGAFSVLLVVVTLTVLVATIGAAGVAFGISAAEYAPGRPWQRSILGGACGGTIVGGFVKLLGIDTFQLLFGRSPGDITGSLEGMILGAAVGFGVWLASREANIQLPGLGMRNAAVVGCVTGMAITLMGGRLMSGSLALLSERFPDSQLRLEPFGSLFADSKFQMIGHILTGGLEGALFCACIVGAIVINRERSVGLDASS